MSDATFANGRVTINKPVGERAPLTQGRKADYEGLADVLEQMTTGQITGKSQFVKHAPLWTLEQIKLLIDIHGGYDHPGDLTVEHHERLRRFHEVGLIDRIDFPALTEKGRAFINMLLNTPLPVLQIVDPRTGQVVA